MLQQYIDRHTRVIDEILQSAKKDFGVFFTPVWVVEFMINLIDKDILSEREISVLEPACGLCMFLNGIKAFAPDLYSKSIRKIGVEINPEIIKYFRNNIENSDIVLVNSDYLLWESKEKFDLILGNPPYGIPSLSSHYTIRVDNKTKQKYKEIFSTWYGKYNVYGAFIEKSVRLLKNNGQLLFIVPATFMILDDFVRLRQYLAHNGRTELFFMGNDVFKPNADITTVVLKFTKSQTLKGELLLNDFVDGKIHCIKKENHWNGEIVTFSTDFTREIDKICSLRLKDIFQIRISPRTPEIKNNPQIYREFIPDKNLLPILNGKNLKIGKVIYEPISGYFIEDGKKTMLREFFAYPHIVVGLGYRGNGQLGAAYDEKAYPWMGDVYHLLRRKNSLFSNVDMADFQIVEYLNSEIVSRYLKHTFRNITYHFNITQLNYIPLPTAEELNIIKKSYG